MSGRKVAFAAVTVGFLAVFIWWVLPKNKAAPSPQRPSESASSQPSSPTNPPNDPIEQAVDGIVARYRKTIVLLADDPSTSDTDKEKVSLVGKIIFQENHESISSLSNDLTTEMQAAGDFA